MDSNRDHKKNFSEEVVIPVVKENLTIDTSSTITGTITIQKEVNEQNIEVELTDSTTNYIESRIPFNVVVDEIPQIRTEGDTTIIPVIREEAVVVKRLVLVEEIHLRKEVQNTDRTETVTLREESVRIERN